MAFQGFGKNSGPSNPPRAQTLFGNFPTSSPSPPQASPPSTLFGNFPTSSSPSPPQIPSAQNFPQQRSPQTPFGNFSTSPPQVRSTQNFPQQQRSPRPTLSPPRLGNHPKLLSNDLNFQSYQASSPVAPYLASHNAAAGIPSRPANSQGPKRTRSPPSANAGFMEDPAVDRRRGPRGDFLHEDGAQVIPQRMWSPPLAYESNHSYEDLDRPPADDQRPTPSPPRLGNHPKLLSNNLNFQSYQTSSPVAPYSASRNAASGIPSRPANSQEPKRTRSPPSANAGFMEDPAVDRRRGPRGDFLHEDGGQVIPQRMWSPPLAYESNHSYEDLDRPPVEDQRSHTKVANFQVLKGTKSPPLSSANEVPWRASHPPRNDSDRPVESPPRMGNKSTMMAYNSNPQTQQSSSNFAASIVERAGTKRDNNQFPKRTRSPSSSSAGEVSPGNPHANLDDTEREMQAKAKRLARFKVELTQPEQSSHDASKHKVSGNRHDPALAEKKKFVAEHPREGAGDLMVSDYEGLDSSSVIIGLCPDMCPETERAERERKGDLDKYERLDGDRNQTSKSIAVKKYNRTAEREVDLIRPLPVLQKTVAYLLDLLDQPYDDRFLKLYNFLWDRMRAVRMDLRMQHIFNQDAITMLEQMIRLHVIAMHELCEYTKGEGFSEGFDAHLNIEQMNKTSVELFQMYDDHRKRGIIVPSEKEFRGYYALLKLDKHPGYKVEPAELSLDLAKMTPEIRQTPEILFARDVARACRTGNFIAFFRLARRTTYLQACLMHAHFAKLRTQALASLHSGLQNNQGIPIPQVTKWLGMEGEDIESLLEYHGFTIKEFEEPYMVKDGLFLNDEKDYPTKCSQLVLLKKSSTIAEDVSSGRVVWPAKEQVVSDRIGKLGPKSVRLVTPKTLIDEDMLEFKDEPTPVVHSQVHPVLQIPVANDQSESESSDHQGSEVSEVSLMSWNAPSSPCSPQPLSAMARRMRNQETLPDDSLEMKLRSPVKEKTVQSMIRDPPIDSYQGSYADSLAKNSAPQRTVINPQENVEAMIVHQEVESEESLLISQEVEDEAAKMAQWKYEAASATLKLILRIWKRRSSKKKMLRERRLMAAKAALNSLTLGPPIQQNKTQHTHVPELNLDHVLRERHERYGRSWSRLNVSEVIARILGERNPDANCLSWKLIICSQTKGIGQTNILAGHWLLSKLMGTSKENDDDLAVSSPGLSIWKKWVTRRLGCPPVCCLSVIRDMEVHKSDDTVAGASAALFLVSDSIPWEVQKTAFYNLLMSLPPGSRLPLLILSDMCDEEVQTSSLKVINELGLHYLDKTRISSFSIIYLLGNRTEEHLDGFFSNDRLMEGLQWLASESSLQPALCCVKSRDLVMGHFNCSLEMLDKTNVSLLGPNHCITAFNAALDRATEEVTSAASTNFTSWPCPEIDLLESSSDEHRAVESFLPIVGWSSAASIKPIISTMQDSKLPFFAEDLSWLSHGSDMREEIENHKAELEKCLIRYLTHSSQMMEWGLATMEASALLQKSAQLELHGVNSHIIPRWVAIFRRISNWRLMNLTSGISSVTYVSRKQKESSCAEPCDMASPASEGLWLDGDRYPTALTQPSLDEMIEASCCPLPFGRNEPESKIIQPLPETIDEGNESSQATNTSGFVEDGGNLPQYGEFRNAVDASLSDSYVSSIFVVSSEVKKEADRLSKLLQQCNMLQDSIDEKLSIYF